MCVGMAKCCHTLPRQQSVCAHTFNTEFPNKHTICSVTTIIVCLTKQRIDQTNWYTNFRCYDNLVHACRMFLSFINTKCLNLLLSYQTSKIFLYKWVRSVNTYIVYTVHLIFIFKFHWLLTYVVGRVSIWLYHPQCV